jgi:hypothetical protein
MMGCQMHRRRIQQDNASGIYLTNTLELLVYQEVGVGGRFLVDFLRVNG